MSPASLTTPTVEVEDMQGHRDRGRLSVISPPVDGVAYVRAPAPEGPYVAHATGYARDPMVPPASQSVLAGLHGDALNPEVAWSVSFDKVPGIAEWAIFYEDDAQRVQVSPAYDLYPWLPVEATVHAGAINLRVSGESAGTFHPGGLGDVTHIGIGDVTAAFLDRPRARGSAYYDDAAVYRLP